jgi:chromosome segregation ATPase
LRKQLAEMGEKFVLANQAFTAGRKQHDLALEKLRRDLELSREEVQVLQKKLDAQAQRAAHEEQGRQRHQEVVATEETLTLKAELEWAKGELSEVRQQLAAAQAEVEAEKAKVFLMEAAAVGVAKDAQDAESDSKNRAKPAAESTEEKGSDTSQTELMAQLTDLQKQNTALRAARDRVHDDLAQMKKKLAARDHEDGTLESALTELESGIKEVVWAISARRERQA